MPNQAEINAILEKAKLRMGKSIKGDRAASQKSDSLQVLVDQIEESTESIRPELEEWASAVSEITRQVEVLGEIGSLIQERISNLQRVANFLGTPKSKKPPQYQSVSVADFVEVDSSPPQAAPAVEAVAVQAAPAPSGQDPGLTYSQWIGQGLANQVEASGQLQGAQYAFANAWGGNNNHD